MSMTADDIIEVSKIMLKADGGCGFCAAALLRKLRDKYPQHEDSIVTAWLTTYPTAYGWQDM